MVTFYWRLKDIPELRDVAKKVRRGWWREVVTRSTSAGRLLGMFGLRFAAAGVFMLTSAAVLPDVSPLWAGLLGMVCAGLASDFVITQPRARRWLREHAGELDRYIRQ